MSNKRKQKEDIILIENLVQDQLNLIESRLRELESVNAPEEALKKAKAALGELYDSGTLIKALVEQVKDNDDSQSVKAGGG